MKKKLCLIELNEINFDFLQNYIQKYNLKHLSNLSKLKKIKTKSEIEYDKLEPWIQWVSVHTGENYDNHKIFRLGDIKKYTGSQIFETVEQMGYSVGAISPMNADLRMSKPDFFIPDPWTDSKSDGSFWSSKIHDVLRQVVNDNSEGKITLRSKFFLILALLKFAKFKNYYEYFQLAFGAFKGKRWNKALFLDLFICDMFLCLTSKNQTKFSTLFLNSFAHIQHHYFYNSEFYSGNSINPRDHISQNSDPMKDGAFFFNNRIKDLLTTLEGYDFLIATGLSQIPYKGEKYLYRLKNHSNFLELIGMDFINVKKRMTRDFEITFQCNISRDNALKLLSRIKINNISAFRDIEVRDKSLFVNLSYSKKILESDYVLLNNEKIFIFDHVVTVTFKNGEHCSVGYAFLSKGIDENNDKNINVWEIKDIILKYFKRSVL